MSWFALGLLHLRTIFACAYSVCRHCFVSLCHLPFVLSSRLFSVPLKARHYSCTDWCRPRRREQSLEVPKRGAGHVVVYDEGFPAVFLRTHTFLKQTF